MRLAIARVLTTAQLGTMRGLLARGTWADGARTAGSTAASVKLNRQLRPDCAEYRRAAGLVEAALGGNETFQAAALPRIVSAPLFSRYDAGMGYGPHLDNALMHGPTIRTDLAWTLFVSPPEDYSGGELVLMEAEGESAVKLDAGALFLYPATALHRVETVTSGRREVCVGWVQSLVRDARVREMIFDLSRAKAAWPESAPHGEAFTLVSKVASNLLRLHVET